MAQVQIGIVARRSEAGDFLPGTPICHEVPDTDLTPERLTEQEDKVLTDLAKVFAEYYHKHLELKRRDRKELT